MHPPQRPVEEPVEIPEPEPPAKLEHHDFDSWVETADYDAAKKELALSLNGRGYVYRDVPPEIFRGLIGAEDPGRYYLDEIKSTFDHD